MRFEAFMARVDRLHRDQPSRRYGQLLILELREVRPMLADTLQSGSKDPYYKQRKEECQEALDLLNETYKD